MEKMTLEELKGAPEKLEPYINGGETVRITKQGEPFFDAVPAKKEGGLMDFFRRLDQVWANSGITRSTEDLMASLRQSRE